MKNPQGTKNIDTLNEVLKYYHLSYFYYFDNIFMFL